MRDIKIGSLVKVQSYFIPCNHCSDPSKVTHKVIDIDYKGGFIDDRVILKPKDCPNSCFEGVKRGWRVAISHVSLVKSEGVRPQGRDWTNIFL